MSDQDCVFNIQKLQGRPVDIISILQKKLYLKQDSYFSIGDVVLTCGLSEGLECIRLLPEKSIKRVVNTIVTPAIKRICKNVVDENIQFCIEEVRSFIFGQTIDINLLKNTALSFLQKFEYTSPPNVDTDFYYLKSINHEQHIPYIVVLMLVNLVFDKKKKQLDKVVDILNYISKSSATQSKELLLQKEDIIWTFPPQHTHYSSSDKEEFSSNVVIRFKSNWFLKRIGFKKKDQTTYYFKWGSLKPEWGFKFEIIEFDKEYQDDDSDHCWFLAFNFIYGSFWIKLPLWLPKHKFSELGQSSIRKWGFYGSLEGNSTFCVSFGKDNKYFDLPWTLDHIRTHVLMKDGSWQSEPDWDSTNPTREEFEESIATETHSFKYQLKNGTIQYRLARIHVREWEWRYKLIKSFPIFKKIRRAIDVRFSDEVGERSGSWKGGTIGCTYDMKLNEYPIDTLRRMERDRNFL